MSELVLSEENLRKMPFSMEAEQSVLGTVILDPEKLNEIAAILRADDFYIEQHVRIYEAMRSIFARADAHLDEVTLLEELVTSGTLDEAGGKAYITTLAESVPDINNLMDYVRIIKDKAVLRRLIEASNEIGEMAYSAEGETKDILDRSEQLIFDIAEKNETKGLSHIRDVIVELYHHLESLKKNGTDALGTPTYFTDIEKYLVGMGKGDFIIIGARPGVGKTSFALNIAANVAQKAPHKAVAVFSLEMSCEQLVSRVLASEARIDSYHMRSGELTEEEWEKLARSAGLLAETNILIDDTPGISVTGMKAKLRRIKNLGLVIIDYLQLMQSDKHTENRVQEVSDISRNLKLLAKEFEVPVITCAQLSRASEKEHKKPMLSDLRDSGGIEQDADTIMFLSRDYYKDDPEKENIADCIIAKNRHGSTGTVTLGWLGQYTKFMTMDTSHAAN